LEKVAKIPGKAIKSFKGKEFKYLTPGEQPDLPKATSKGKLTFSTFGKPIIVIEKENGETERLEIPYPQHVQHPNITLVVKSLQGIGQSPSNGETGIWATILMDQITAKR